MNEPVIEFSESRAAIAKALFVMQTNLGDVKKNASNPHFKSKYADLGAVVEAVSPALELAKLTLLQGCAGNGDEGSVTVETMLLHESGEFVRARLTLRPSKADPQGAGSAITYARRYGLQSLCGVCPEDDDGNAASRPANTQTFTPARQNGNGNPPPPETGANSGEKIGEKVRGDFMALYGKMPPTEFEGIIKEVQGHHKNDPTGNVADLHEGDEARDAYKFLLRKAKELASVERV